MEQEVCDSCWIYRGGVEGRDVCDVADAVIEAVVVEDDSD